MYCYLKQVLKHKGEILNPPDNDIHLSGEINILSFAVDHLDHLFIVVQLDDLPEIAIGVIQNILNHFLVSPKIDTSGRVKNTIQKEYHF